MRNLSLPIPNQIPIRQVTDLTGEDAQLSYKVKNERSDPMTELNCKLEVNGAEVGGLPLYFMLQASPPQLCHSTTSAGWSHTL